ncbi:MAG: flippase [Deltaproteobacteria bacterium]
MGVIKNSIFILTARGIQIVSSSFIVIAIARYLSVEMYGDYAYVIALVSAVMALTYFGIQQVTIREIAKDRANAHLYIGSAIVLRGGLAAIAAVTMLVSMLFIKPSNLMSAGIAVAIVSESFLTFGMLFRAVFQAFEKMLYEPLITIIYCIALSAGIAVVIYFDMGFLWLLIVTAAANAVQCAAAAFIVSYRFVRPSFMVDKKIFKALLVHSSVIGLGIFFYQNLFRIDVLMLKWLGSAKEVALFQVPHNMVMQVEILPAALMAALFPVLSRLMKSDPDRVVDVYEKSFRYIFILSLILSIYLCLFSKEIIGIVFGSKYSQSAASFVVVSWAVVPLSMDILLNAVLIVMNKQKYSVYYGGITLAVNFLAALVLIPAYGFMAAAYIALFSYCLLFLFSMYFVAKAGLPVVLDRILSKTVLAGAIGAAGMIWLKQFSIIIALSFGVTAYFGVLLMTGAFPPDVFPAFKAAIKNFTGTKHDR